jgi:DNA-binding FadR family transcriptional regulator
MSATLPARHWPARPRRLATAVVEDLVEQLVRGEFVVGQSLPTEPALCEMFGVSRTVVREAVKSLEGMRLVKAQAGQGTRVRPVVDWDLAAPTVLASFVKHDEENAILEDLIDVRRALESQMAGKAASNASTDERRIITERLRALDATLGDVAAYLEADVAFHDAILAASGNRLGRAMIHNLTVEAYRSIRYVGDPDAEHMRLTNQAHHQIHDAVVSGDADRAARLMDQHITESWRRRRSQAP